MIVRFKSFPNGSNRNGKRKRPSKILKEILGNGE